MPGVYEDTADGDGRYILNLAESVWAYAQPGEIFDKESIVKNYPFARAGLGQGARRAIICFRRS